MVYTETVQGNRLTGLLFEGFFKLGSNGKTLRRDPVTNLASGFPEQKLAKGVAGFSIVPQSGMEHFSNKQSDYSPGPSESVLEDLFWHYVRSTKGGNADSLSQFNIGAYRVDAIFDCSGQAVVIELDGKEYHQWERDLERDSILLNEVSAIIRVPYRAMKFFPFATFKVLSEWYPRFEMLHDSRTMTSSDLRRLYDEEVHELPDDEIQDWFLQYNDVTEVWSGGRTQGIVGPPQAFIKAGRMSVINRRLGKTSETLVGSFLDEVRRRKGA